MFCTKCGKQIADGMNFCGNCGTPVSQKTMEAVARMNGNATVQPTQNVVQAGVQYAGQVSAQPGMQYAGQTGAQYTGCPVPAGKKIRIRCAKCGRVDDFLAETPCPTCGTALPQPAGYVKFYRMGNFYGMAGGFGIYIDNIPCGYIGNKQTCWIRLPYGRHLIHVAVGMSRKCNDMEFVLSPTEPLIGARVHIEPGAFTNKFVIERISPAALPD